MKPGELFSRITIMFGTAALIGCGHQVQFDLTNTGQNFNQSTSSFTNQLDILWVVDNSASMQPLQTNLTNNFKAAISQFQAKGWDYRMAVTTTEAYRADANLKGYSSANAGLSRFRDGTDSTSHTGVFVVLPTTPNYDSVFVTNANQGANGSGDERAFSSIRSTMNDPKNAGFLRSNSFFAVIILSDEDDFSSDSRIEGSWTVSTSDPNYVGDHDYNYAGLDSVQTYVNYLDTLTNTTGAYRRYNVSSITVLDQNCYHKHLNDSPSTIIGQRYIQLSQATNGILGSVCDSSYANSLTSIAQQIATLSTQFFLNITPNPSSIQVIVNNVSVPHDPQNGWTYNAAANSVQFHGSAIPPQGASIVVNFLPDSANH